MEFNVNFKEDYIIFKPFCNSYQAIVSMFGAILKTIMLYAPNFDVPKEETCTPFSTKIWAIFAHTPLCPIGKVFL